MSIWDRAKAKVEELVGRAEEVYGESHGDAAAQLNGEAPRAATVTAAVPAFARRRTGPASRIAAYIGVPLVTADGELFGTLCAWGFRARPRSAARDLPLVETMARLLSTLISTGMTLPDPPSGPGPAA